MQLAGQKSPQKPPGFQLTSAVWKFDELICVSHIVSLISVTRIVPVRTSCSFCMCYDILWCLLCCWDVRTFLSPVRIQRRITYSFLLISQSAIKMKHVHKRSELQKFAAISNSLKKGNENTTHNTLQSCSHVCSHWLTVSEGNCPACCQKANWHLIRLMLVQYLVLCPLLFITGYCLLWRLTLVLLSFKHWHETQTFTVK